MTEHIFRILLSSASGVKSSQIAEDTEWSSQEIAGELRSMRNEGLVAYRSGVWALTTDGREVAKKWVPQQQQHDKKDLSHLPNYRKTGKFLGAASLWSVEREIKNPDKQGWVKAALGDPGLCRTCGGRCVWSRPIGTSWIGQCTCRGLSEHQSGHAVKDYELNRYSGRWSPANPAYPWPISDSETQEKSGP